MVSPKTFYTQLVNSVVHHLTPDTEASEAVAFMLRSELVRRYREFMEGPGTFGSTGEKTAMAIAMIFFKGDIQATMEQMEKATVDDEDHYYTVELAGLGKATIIAIDL